MIYSYTHPFILFFNNHLLSTYYVPRMILGAEAIEVKKKHTKTCSFGTSNKRRKAINKYIIC